MTVPPIEAPTPPLTCLELCAEKKVDVFLPGDFFWTTLGPLMIIVPMIYPCTLGAMKGWSQSNRKSKAIVVIASISFAALSWYFLYLGGKGSAKVHAKFIQGCLTGCGFG